MNIDINMPSTLFRHFPVNHKLFLSKTGKQIEGMYIYMQRMHVSSSTKNYKDTAL